MTILAGQLIIFLSKTEYLISIFLPKFVIVSICADIMHNMAEFMEKRFYLIMCEQRWLVGGRFGEIAHHHANWKLIAQSATFLLLK